QAVEAFDETVKRYLQFHGDIGGVLKEGSPSCGSGYTYDGSFSGARIAREGVTAACLTRAGVRVFSEHELDAAQAWLRQLETGA
ncbi:DUF523 domain-containing protein, partial [Bordetella bronchiseptica]